MSRYLFGNFREGVKATKHLFGNFWMGNYGWSQRIFWFSKSYRMWILTLFGWSLVYNSFWLKNDSEC